MAQATPAEADSDLAAAIAASLGSGAPGDDGWAIETVAPLAEAPLAEVPQPGLFGSLKARAAERIAEKAQDLRERGAARVEAINEKRVAAGAAVQDAKDNLTSKAKELQQEHVAPRMRAVNETASEVTTTLFEKTSQAKAAIASTVVENVGVGGDEVSVSADSQAAQARRWWAKARAAAHANHDSSTDFGLTPDGEVQSPGAQARGCLEVTVLGFGESTLAFGEPILRPDGAKAQGPICQIALGSQGDCTGALTPSRPQGSDGGDKPQGSDGGDAEEAELRSLVVSLTGGAVSSARFSVDEIAGMDLRVHVFDGDDMAFRSGNETKAFCGGALVPLSVLLQQQLGFEEAKAGFSKQVFEMELGVKLLPMDVYRVSTNNAGLKLQRCERDTGAPKRPEVARGVVFLRLRLTLQQPLARLYVSEPFCEDLQPNVHRRDSFVGSVDDPMSIYKGLGRSMQRFSAAVAADSWGGVLTELREQPAPAAALHSLWAFAMLRAPFHMWPACLLAAVTLAAHRFHRIKAKARAAQPPYLYAPDDGPPDDTRMRERFQQQKEALQKRAGQTLKFQAGLARMAERLNNAASTLEKMYYALSIRDPYISGALGLGVLAACTGAVCSLWVLTRVLGISIPHVVWAGGCFVLLPAKAQSLAVGQANRLQEMKERRFGKGDMRKVFESFWRRIPDAIELDHLELFEQEVLHR